MVGSMTDGAQMANVAIAVAMLLMIVSGTSKRLVVWKRTPHRRCDGCGHEVRNCRCRH